MCLKKQLLGYVLTVLLFATACNNRGNTTDNGADMKDTNFVDTRRNSTDTINYLTNDSGNKSQDVIDPNPPQNSRY